MYYFFFFVVVVRYSFRRKLHNSFDLYSFAARSANIFVAGDLPPTEFRRPGQLLSLLTGFGFAFEP